MRQDDVIDHSAAFGIAFCNGFGLRRIVYFCRNRNKCGINGLVVYCFFANVVGKGEEVVAFNKAGRFGQCNLESIGCYAGFANLLAVEQQRRFRKNAIGVVGCESHLLDLHCWFGVDSLDIDFENALISVACAYRTFFYLADAYGIEVHWLWCEKRHLCLESVGRNVVLRIAEEYNRKCAVG